MKLSGGGIESFMARPGSNNNRSKRVAALEPRSNRVPLVSTAGRIDVHHLFAHMFRRNSLVTWYAENSAAIIYIRITNNKGGSGIIVTRTNASSWSAPCSVHGSLPSGNFQYTDEVDCFIFLRKAQDIQNFQTNKKLSIDITEINFSDHMAITKIADVFYIEQKMKCVIEAREEINQQMYSKVKNLDITRVLEGKKELKSNIIFCAEIITNRIFNKCSFRSYR